MLPRLHAAALDQRRAFIAAYLASDDSVADLARRFRVSRKTAHKFINLTPLFDPDMAVSHGSALLWCCASFGNPVNLPRPATPALLTVIPATTAVIPALLPSFPRRRESRPHLRRVSAAPADGAA